MKNQNAITTKTGSVRRLKIESEGDAWKGRLKPKIRLTGRWLERAGFPPGQHVQVICVRPGRIELRTATKSQRQSGATVLPF